MYRSAWRARLQLPFPAEPAPIETHILDSWRTRGNSRRIRPTTTIHILRALKSEAACLARARGACFPSHHLPDIAHSGPPLTRLPLLTGLTGVEHKQWHAAWRTRSAMGSPWAGPPTGRLPGTLLVMRSSTPNRCSLLFHAPTCLHTLAPMVMSASLSTQLFLRKAAQIQPFLAVPYESRPSLPRRLSWSTACTGMQTERLSTQEVSFRTGHQQGTCRSQIKVWEFGHKLTRFSSARH